MHLSTSEIQHAKSEVVKSNDAASTQTLSTLCAYNNINSFYKIKYFIKY